MTDKELRERAEVLVRDIQPRFGAGEWRNTLGIVAGILAAALENAYRRGVEEHRDACHYEPEKNDLGFLRTMTIRLHNEIADKEAARLLEGAKHG